MRAADLYGLVLTGGHSRRMGQDKGAIVYAKVSKVQQRRRCFDLLDQVCARTFVSCRREQAAELSREFPVIVDAAEGQGPAGGILSAASTHPEAAWFVLACDFPFVSEETVGFLAKYRSQDRPATIYVNDEQMLEPLFAIWEKAALAELRAGCDRDDLSPRRALERVDQQLGCERLQPPVRRALVNINSPEESRRHGLTWQRQPFHGRSPSLK